MSACAVFAHGPVPICEGGCGRSHHAAIGQARKVFIEQELGDGLRFCAACSPVGAGLAPAVAMRNQLPRLLVMDDDRAILSLAGTGISCLDVLRALRGVRPQCEVMMTSYPSVDAAVDAARRTMEEPVRPADTSVGPAETTLLVDVEREHIVRTLRQVRGNKAVAARMLGISRRAFYRQLERHGLHQRIPMTQRAGHVAMEAVE